MSTEKKRNYAVAEHPVVEAIIEGLFQLESREQAEARMKELRSFAIFSREQPEEETAARLWIRGFGLSDAERKKGYMGHFALVHIFKKDDGKWTLMAEKDEVPLEKHPQKARPKKSHPDWGHPMLREIKKGNRYDTFDEAYGILEKLHVEFPDISIPNREKLHIMIYKKQPSGPPIQKMTFYVELAEGDEAGFTIRGEENTYDKKKAEVKKAIASHAEEKIDTAKAILPEGEEAKRGRFANMVELKRARKGKADPRAAAKKASASSEEEA